MKILFSLSKVKASNNAKAASQSNPHIKMQNNRSNNSNSSSNNNKSSNSINNNNNNKDNKEPSSLLGRPRPLQPGAGLMGASPQSPAIIPPFIRRNGNGLLPLPLPNKMAGLMVGCAPVNFASSRVNRSNSALKPKARRPARIIPQDNHDSTTESDEPASAGNKTIGLLQGSRRYELPRSD